MVVWILVESVGPTQSAVDPYPTLKHTHTYTPLHTHQPALNVTWPTPQYRGVNLGGWLVLESWVRALHTTKGMGGILSQSADRSTFLCFPPLHTQNKTNNQIDVPRVVADDGGALLEGGAPVRGGAGQGQGAGAAREALGHLGVWVGGVYVVSCIYERPIPSTGSIPTSLNVYWVKIDPWITTGDEGGPGHAQERGHHAPPHPHRLLVRTCMEDACERR